MASDLNRSGLNRRPDLVGDVHPTHTGNIGGGRKRKTIFWLLLFSEAAFLIIITGCLLGFAVDGLRTLPASEHSRIDIAHQQMVALKHSLRHSQGAERMQRLFPEGACFTTFLYGLAWANLVEQSQDPALKIEGVGEIKWALKQMASSPAVSPFVDTRVTRGVFWLGQRNFLVGRLLQVLGESERPIEFVGEFRNNSNELAQAFLASPTHHIDSYPGLCWPADNVTALCSLLLHDQLYDSNHRQAYAAWKAWTKEHSDPLTGMPAGHLNSRTGLHLQPARGCGSSWMLSILPRFDPEFCDEQYQLYREHFAIGRLGFRMFREYPEGAPADLKSDVDSGPIVFGAGVTATGCGLAAARANGDEEMAADIHALAEMWGLPQTVRHEKRNGKTYLFGLLPVGDAFLALGYSLPAQNAVVYPAYGFVARTWGRWQFFLALLLVAVFLTWRGFILVRRAKYLVSDAA